MSDTDRKDERRVVPLDYERKGIPADANTSWLRSTGAGLFAQASVVLAIVSMAFWFFEFWSIGFGQRPEPVVAAYLMGAGLPIVGVCLAIASMILTGQSRGSIAGFLLNALSLVLFLLIPI